MKKEIAKKWVSALRSGEYKQGFGFLCTEKASNGSSQFCCLGVLTELYIQEKGNSNKYYWSESDYDAKGNTLLRPYLNGHRQNTEILPDAVKRWAGTRNCTGHLSGSPFPGKNNKSVVGLNDSGKSFSYIADFIEKNYERV